MNSPLIIPRQHYAYDALKRGFGVGFNSPLIIVAENVPAVTDADRQAARDQLTAVYNQRVAEATAAQAAAFQKRLAAAKTYAEKLQTQKTFATFQAMSVQQEQQANSNSKRRSSNTRYATSLRK